MTLTSSRATAATGGLALLLLAACATGAGCVASEEVAAGATISGGGVTGMGGWFTIASDGSLFYDNGPPRCVRIKPADLAPVLAKLRSAELREYLRRVDEMGYSPGYADSPHIRLTIDDETTFIPIGLTITEPLQSHLKPLDDLLARHLGRSYHFRVLPPARDHEDIRELGTPRPLPPGTH